MSLSILNTMADDFLSRVESRLGDMARPNGTFFSYRVATTAIQRLRLDVIQNKQVLTEGGERFAAEISAYLEANPYAKDEIDRLQARLDEIIEEVAAARVTERGHRSDDRRSETAMEDRKKQGYF